MKDSSISIKPISDLLTDSEGQPTRFWIPAYQRGYRWKPLQVTQLLDDVWEFIQNSEGGKRQAFYCLQPLVIKAHADGRFEVVDGQQRLTTIYILLTYLNELTSTLGKTRFKITFETRGEANEPFLSKIDLGRAEENVDYFHICEAYRAIDVWFSNRNSMHKLKLLQHFLNDDEAGRNVKVIWFQLSERDNPVDAFTRLNVGKIPLTNDELIRALFLRRRAPVESETEALQLRIAYEWDQLEKALQLDSLWYFLSNEVGPKQNRIGFLFELVARTDGLPAGAEHDPYGIFYAYNQKLKEAVAKPDDEWLKIKHTFMMLEEWFEDRTLYHITGFLIQQRVGIAALLDMSKESTKSEFEQKLRQEVFRRVMGQGTLAEMSEEDLIEHVREKLEGLEYGTHSTVIRALLLLFNVATLLEDNRSNLRFQFDNFKRENWDIEHVRSVTGDQPQRHHDRVAWLKHTLGYLKAQCTEQELQQEIRVFTALSQNEASEEHFEPLYEKVLKAFGESEDDETDHGIANLTLLDQRTNRSYKNAVFAVKRQQLLSLDQAGIFVPLCTRNVFLKCYSPHVDNVMFWNTDDRKGYQDAVEKTLVRFFKGCGEAMV